MRFRIAKASTTEARIYPGWRGGEAEQRADDLATEEPLEIRLAQGAALHGSGDDADPRPRLRAGRRLPVHRGRPGSAPRTGSRLEPAARARGNVGGRAAAGVAAGLAAAGSRLPRPSCCGVCGKASLEALPSRTGRSRGPARSSAAYPPVAGDAARRPRRLRSHRRTARCGACSTPPATLLAREDVGRHNALDKFIGAALLAGRRRSRRLSWSAAGRLRDRPEGAVAGIPLLRPSAPRSLAVSWPRLADPDRLSPRDRFNIYCGPDGWRESKRRQDVPQPVL